MAQQESATPTVISREMTIEDIFRLFPHKSQKLAQELTNTGLHCVGCQAAVWETLEAGVLSHGKSEEELDALIGRLNAILEEKIVATTIEMTERAAEKYLAILEAEGKLGWGLRYSEKLAGCNGYEYVLDYSEKPNEDDVIFVSNGIEIHIHNTLKDKFLGSVIDYVDGLYGAGFKVTNPNVQSACGCGNSHNY